LLLQDEHLEEDEEGDGDERTYHLSGREAQEEEDEEDDGDDGEEEEEGNDGTYHLSGWEAQEDDDEEDGGNDEDRIEDNIAATSGGSQMRGKEETNDNVNDKERINDEDDKRSDDEDDDGNEDDYEDDNNGEDGDGSDRWLHTRKRKNTNVDLGSPESEGEMEDGAKVWTQKNIDDRHKDRHRRDDNVDTIPTSDPEEERETTERQIRWQGSASQRGCTRPNSRRTSPIKTPTQNSKRVRSKSSSSEDDRPLTKSRLSREGSRLVSFGRST
jgi:hypothetical protein